MSQQLLTALLKGYEQALGLHFEKYHHHAIRVYHFSVRLAGASEDEDERYLLAVSAAFHDLGIWTHGTFDYLGPSELLAKDFLIKQGRPELIPDVLAFIDLHHKLRPIRDNRLAEAFRKADLIDLSLGLIRFGISSELWSDLNLRFPKKGFHRFIGGKIVKSILQHPWNPLPIVKW
ncbi:MAG: HD domain-containing protein [Bacteroidia bacterium]|nr:HD domain-containing protein [Bacteroidia bacterium]